MVKLRELYEAVGWDVTTQKYTGKKTSEVGQFTTYQIFAYFNPCNTLRLRGECQKMPW
jgi:hypothetical protein